MSYSISLTPTAEKDLKSLPRKIQTLTLQKIKILEINVTPDGKRIKKLKGMKGAFYRLRTGDYRALFEVEGKQVFIHRVIDRKELDQVASRLVKGLLR